VIYDSGLVVKMDYMLVSARVNRQNYVADKGLLRYLLLTDGNGNMLAERPK